METTIEVLKEDIADKKEAIERDRKVHADLGEDILKGWEELEKMEQELADLEAQQ